MQIVLNVIKGPHQGKLFSFDQHEHFFVGRAKFAHFCLPEGDPYFSRVHFMIEVNPPACRLLDLGSTNGTWVNGEQAQTVDLKDGDIIEGGDTAISVSLVSTIAPTITPIESGDNKRPKSSATIPVTTRQSELELPVIDGYEVVEEIGRGGMGIVYKAIRVHDQLTVAIKIIKPAIVGSRTDYERFLREVSILESLDHTGIVGYHGSGETGQLLFLVMEYFPGQDATKWLAGVEGNLPIPIAVGMVCKVLEALSYAHSRYVIHRDVKPSNLLVVREGNRLRVKLADFGLAKVYHDSKLSGLTLTGAVCGTPKFMSPEQILDSRCVKTTADQYSAAATLYFLLTRQFTHDFGKPVQQVLHQILLHDAVPIQSRRTDIPEALSMVIQKALTRDPLERFPSVSDFRDALRPFERKS